MLFQVMVGLVTVCGCNGFEVFHFGALVCCEGGRSGGCWGAIPINCMLFHVLCRKLCDFVPQSVGVGSLNFINELSIDEKLRHKVKFRFTLGCEIVPTLKLGIPLTL